MNNDTDTPSVDEQDEIEAATIEAGPSTDELEGKDQGAATGAAGANDGAGDGDSEPTHFRVRIERFDGSRIWHVEQASSAEQAMTLAANRFLGDVRYAEPLDSDDGND